MNDFKSVFIFWRYVHKFFSNFIDNEHKNNFDKIFFDSIDNTSSKSVYMIFRDLLHCLNDAHTDVFEKNRIISKNFGLKVKSLHSKYLVIGASDEVSTLVPIGSEILEINDMNLETLVNDNVKQFSYSRLEYGVEKVLNYLLSDAFCHEPWVTFKSPDGNINRIRLKYVFDRVDFSLVGSIPSFSSKEKVLNNEIAYFFLPSFTSEEEIDSIIQDLNQLNTVSKLILDLRGNCGGNGLFAMKLLSFISNIPLYGVHWRTPTFNAFHTAYFNNMDSRQNIAEDSHWYMGKSEIVYPDSAVSIEKICILIDCETISAAEDFLLYARQMDNCVFIGETSAGSSGMPINLDLGGNYWCQITTKHDYIQQPNDFIRKGIPPDYPVSHSFDSLIAKIDKPLQYAIEH